MKQEPFFGHREQFAKIPLQERSQWIKGMLETPQKEGKPKLFRNSYPQVAFWDHKEVKMHYYSAAGVEKPSAVLLHFHGLNSHGGSSGYFGTKIAAEADIHVHAMDFKNFGRSGGDERGYIDSFESCVEQAQAFVEYIVSLYKYQIKVFLSGSSYGGTIAFKMALRKPTRYAGIVFLAPGLRELKESQYIMKKLGKAMGYLFPTLKLMDQVYTSGTKYKLAEEIVADKCNYTDKVIPGSIRVVLNAMQEIEEKYADLSTPYILFQSGIDKLVDPFAPLDLQRVCGVKDKTTVYCRDMWHSLFYEEEIEHITTMTANWLKIRK